MEAPRRSNGGLVRVRHGCGWGVSRWVWSLVFWFLGLVGWLVRLGRVCRWRSLVVWYQYRYYFVIYLLFAELR